MLPWHITVKNYNLQCRKVYVFIHSKNLKWTSTPLQIRVIITFGLLTSYMRRTLRTLAVLPDFRFDFS